MHSACLALCLLCLVPFTMACYIQNCPLGGKRSIMDTQMRQCLPCGPDDRGRCFGPRICCGRDIGCYVGTAETLGCRGENYLPSPCEPAGRPCGSERGKCASPGICCDDGYTVKFIDYASCGPANIESPILFGGLLASSQETETPFSY
uniref:Oxytocin n=1 Tax=Callorhinchus milii TaxID=7868 RepID=A0A4W3IES7_CALMI